MKKTNIVLAAVLAGSLLVIADCYGQPAQPAESLIRKVDIDRDGKPEMWVFSADTRTELDSNDDGKADIVHTKKASGEEKVEADTNYDGKPDVFIFARGGKFISARSDTDYDGRIDRKFNDPEDFRKWVNDEKPKLKTALDRFRVSASGVGIVLFKF